MQLHAAVAVSVSLGFAACTPAEPAQSPSSTNTTSPQPPPAALAPPTPTDGSAASVEPVTGPIRIDPPFDKLEYSGWVGVSMFENLVSYGFGTDGKVFANCHVDRSVSLFTKGCDLIHLGGKIDHVVSTTDYGDGHAAAKDAVLDAALAPLGVPAPPGSWHFARALTLTWSAHMKEDLPDALTFSLRNDHTGKLHEIARFDKTDSGDLAIYPRDAIVSPDGEELALVVSYVGAPPLLVGVKLVHLANAGQELVATTGAP